MMRLQQRSFSWPGAAFAFLVLSSGSGYAAPNDLRNRPISSAQAAPQFAIADFDGDSLPDFAIVQAGQSGSSDTRYWILFRLSTGLRQTVGITAPAGGLQLASRDVNGDSFLDVVVTTAWTNRPVAVLLNDGRGSFARSDPSAFRGAFWDSTSSWIRKTAEIKDSAAALLPRHPSGVCEASEIYSPRKVFGVLVPLALEPFRLSLVAPFLSRAPPRFL
jgi:hypothetical protein